jgi:hypothetical protein
MSDLPAFYLPDGDRFVATVSTRGPWSRGHQHAGPPSALLARAMERLAGDGVRLARVTLDFLRPIPIAPLTVTADVARAGAKVRRLRAALADGDGTVLVTATAVALRTTPMLSGAIADDAGAPPPPEEAKPFDFSFFPEPVGYHTAMEGRAARGTWGQGPMAMWMRQRVPLVAGEAPSPVQRLLVCADSASGIAVVLDPRRHSFMNVDLGVALDRAPEGEWICVDARTSVAADGVGLTRGRLWDRRGAVGASLQSLLIESRAT